MITSVSEFTALIPPTCGLTHVAVTALLGYWCEEGGRREERRGKEAASCSTGFCLHKLSHTHRGKVGGSAATESFHRLRVVGKQRLSQVKLLPYFSLGCYSGKSLSR